MSVVVINADMRTALAALPAASHDAMVSDPPYEIGFMGNDWDSNGVALDTKTWMLVHRVLKSDAMLLAFASPRMQHRIASAIERAGFEIVDVIAWFYTQGMPKQTSDLKPAYEPCIVARKGNGRLFVERNLIPYENRADLARTKAAAPGRPDLATSGVYGSRRKQQIVNPAGRRPPNVAMDLGARMLVGEAARIVYVPKVRGAGRVHPTQKPVDLMRYLVRLACPPGGCVIDPFCGSGSTLVAAKAEGFGATGIEINPAFASLARSRI